MSDSVRIPVQPNSILLGDCLEILQRFDSNTVSACITDPPYGLSAQPDMRDVLRHWLAGDDYEHRGGGFMGRRWDAFCPGPKIWQEVMRVLKPGGHILSFSGSRTYDMMVTAMRLAGSEIRDQINVHCEIDSTRDWVYGSGFPKSLNISKMLDKTAGAEREVIGERHGQGLPSGHLNTSGGSLVGGKSPETTPITAPATDAAKLWDGYGSALKPAHEPIADFSKGDAKPLEGAPFLYTAKAASKERNAGCGHLFWKMVDDSHVRIAKEEYEALKAENEAKKDLEGFASHRIAEGCPHPTVKPIQLCRWLVKLVKQPGDNLILDPFCGSGSILCACELEDCNYIGIDMDPMSVTLSMARTAYWKAHGKR